MYCMLIISPRAGTVNFVFYSALHIERAQEMYMELCKPFDFCIFFITFIFLVCDFLREDCICFGHQHPKYQYAIDEYYDEEGGVSPFYIFLIEFHLLWTEWVA